MCTHPILLTGRGVGLYGVCTSYMYASPAGSDDLRMGNQPVQWSLSILDTCGMSSSVQINRVSSFQRWICFIKGHFKV